MVLIIDLNNVLRYFGNFKVSISYSGLSKLRRSSFLDLLDDDDQEFDLTRRNSKLSYDLSP